MKNKCFKFKIYNKFFLFICMLGLISCNNVENKFIDEWVEKDHESFKLSIEKGNDCLIIKQHGSQYIGKIVDKTIEINDGGILISGGINKEDELILNKKIFIRKKNSIKYGLSGLWINQSLSDLMSINYNERDDKFHIKFAFIDYEKINTEINNGFLRIKCSNSSDKFYREYSIKLVPNNPSLAEGSISLDWDGEGYGGAGIKYSKCDSFDIAKLLNKNDELSKYFGVWKCKENDKLLQIYHEDSKVYIKEYYNSINKGAIYKANLYYDPQFKSESKIIFKGPDVLYYKRTKPIIKLQSNGELLYKNEVDSYTYQKSSVEMPNIDYEKLFYREDFQNKIEGTYFGCETYIQIYKVFDDYYDVIIEAEGSKDSYSASYVNGYLIDGSNQHETLMLDNFILRAGYYEYIRVK